MYHTPTYPGRWYSGVHIYIFNRCTTHLRIMVDDITVMHDTLIISRNSNQGPSESCSSFRTSQLLNHNLESMKSFNICWRWREELLRHRIVLYHFLTDSHPSDEPSLLPSIVPILVSSHTPGISLTNNPLLGWRMMLSSLQVIILHWIRMVAILLWVGPTCVNPNWFLVVCHLCYQVKYEAWYQEMIPVGFN